MLSDFYKWFMENHVEAIRVFMVITLGVPLVAVSSSLLRKYLKKRVSDQLIMLITKTLTYGGFSILAITVLRELGFKLTALLGAAGLAGVALSFASQTSLSNLISGAFLVWEKPFQIGDLIKVDPHMGIVESINLLSVNLRTFDNLLIRIPNESLLKSSFVNITKYPIRRMDMNIGVAYKEDIDKVVNVLKTVANNNPYCLDEPEPVIIFKGFGDSALEFLFAPWFVKTDYANLRNSILKEIKERFDEEGIEIPFPHRTLYAGAATDPFPIRIIEKPENQPEEEK